MAKPQPYRSDATHPLNADTDAFGHEDYVTALCRTVQVVHPQFTLGLFAQWGTGKSLILEEATRRINTQKDVGGRSTTAVIFNVWKYEEDDSLRREFVRDLGKQLKDNKQLKSGFDLDRHLERFDADVVDFRPSLRWDWRPLPKALVHAVVAAVVLACILFLLPVLGASASAIDGKKVVTAAVGGVLTFVFSAFAQMVRIEQIQVSRKRLQDSDEFARSFEKLLRDGLAADRLVIGIDNLDRCSPNRVTELLATIKTFLEPAETTKELVFLIAADDAALRRHLISQELAASGGASSAPGEQEGVKSDADHVPEEVRDAVDEYLRKFFNGVLRINDLLDEDIREFTRKELSEFITAHSYESRVETQLVELVASALKQNPRRIKQFINGLELRLQVLAERKASKRIQIDPDVLVVSKLAVIEEQWPEKFELLKRDPRKLGEWHAAARRGRDQIDGDRDDADQKPDTERAWSTFLRFTEQIRAADLRPYLTLQQSQAERDLPRYRDFVEALQAGEAAALDALFEDPDVQASRSGYLDEVVPLLRRDLNQGYYGGATNIVRSSVEAAALASIEASVLEVALPHPQLRVRLADISFTALFEAADHLSDPQFNQVADVALGKFAGDEADSESRNALSGALIRHLSRLDENRRQRISGALRNEQVRRDFASYVQLAEAAPDLLANETVDDALSALDATTGWTADEPAYRVLRAALTSANENPPPSVVHRLAQVIAKSLFEHAAQEEEADAFEVLATEGAQLIGGLDVPRTQVDDVIETVDGEWAELQTGLRATTMDFVGAVLDAGTKEFRAQQGPLFVDRYFNESPVEATEWAASKTGDLAASLAPSVYEQLALQASGATEYEEVRRRATKAVLALETETRSSTMVRTIRLASEQGRYGRAADLLNEFASSIGDEGEQLTGDLFVAAEGAPAQPEAVRAMSTLRTPLLSSDFRDRRSQFIAGLITAEVEGWEDAYARVYGDEADTENATRVVERVFDHVAQDGQDLHSHLEQVNFLLDNQHRLSASHRTQLGTLLLGALEQRPPHLPQRPTAPIASALGRFEGVATDERKDWVTKMILAERQREDHSDKEALLRAAGSLAGRRNSKAYEVLEDRIKELKKGDDEDKELAARLDE